MNARKQMIPLLVCSLSFAFAPNSWAEETSMDARIQELTRELGSPDYELRLKAQDKMLDLAQQFYTKLAGGLNSEDPEIRRGALDVLSKVESMITIARIAARLPETQRAGLQQLRQTDAKLYTTLGNPAPAVRKKACPDIAKLSPEFSVPVLAALAADQDPIVRRHAIRGLGTTGSVLALPHLKKWVEQPDDTAEPEAQVPGVQNVFRAIQINGMNGDQADVGLESRSVSEIAIESIGMIKHADAAQFLIAGLEDHAGASYEDYLHAMEETGQTDAVVTALLPKLDDARNLSTLSDANGPLGQLIQAQVIALGDSSKIQPTTVGDAAFLSILKVTGQTPDSYGIEAPRGGGLKVLGNGMALMQKGEVKIEVNAAGNGEVQINGQPLKSSMFPSEDARTQAIAKLKAWIQHSQKAAATQK